MAELEVSGLSELIQDLDALADSEPEICRDILKAQADVVEPALKRAITSHGLVRSAKLLTSIARRTGRSKGGQAIRIGPKGEHHRYFPKNGSGIVSAGYVGYIAEYGIQSRGIKPRLWMKEAVSASREKAAEAAEKIYDTHLKNKNF